MMACNSPKHGTRAFQSRRCRGRYAKTTNLDWEGENGRSKDQRKVRLDESVAGRGVQKRVGLGAGRLDEREAGSYRQRERRRLPGGGLMRIGGTVKVERLVA